MAHFEPDKITVTGEGVFPRVIFDLPADKEDYRYEEMAKQAHLSLGRENSNLSDKSVGDVPFRALADVSSTLIEQIILTAPPNRIIDRHCRRIKTCSNVRSRKSRSITK